MFYFDLNNFSSEIIWVKKVKLEHQAPQGILFAAVITTELKKHHPGLICTDQNSIFK
jgi:hypothetical protein